MRNNDINQLRRGIVKAMSAAALLPAGALAMKAAYAATEPDPWLQAQAIIDRVSKPLAFRAQDSFFHE